MINERLAGTISQVERRQHDPLQLEAGVNLLGRTLLYAPLDPQDEIAGFRFLKRFTSHTDAKIKELVGGTFEDRWRKVGFYDVWEASDDPMFKRERTTFHGERHGRTLSDTARIAIVELGKSFVTEPNKPLTVRELDDRLFAMLGPRIDTEAILEELSRKYVLTDEAEFTTLLEVQKGRIRVATSAFNYLMPHIPILGVISTPEKIIPDADVKVIRGVQGSLKHTYDAVKKYPTDENLAGLTIAEDDEPFMFWFAPSLSTLDWELDEDRKRDEHQSTIREKEVVYPDNKGNLHSVSHYQTFSGSRPSSEGSLTISKYSQPPGARNQIMIDFWGKIIKGNPTGRTHIYYDARGGVTIHAQGDLRPSLPEGLESAEEVEMNGDGLKLIWQDISGTGRHIFAMLHFRNPFRLQNPFYDTFARPVYHVTGRPDVFIVSKANPDYIDPKKMPDTENDGLNLPSFNSRTNEQEVRFDDRVGRFAIPHPDGGYALRYRRGADAVEVVLGNRRWECKLIIPNDLDVVAIARSMGRRFTGAMSTVLRDRKFISEQVANHKRLNLVEFDAYTKLSGMSQSDFWQYYFNKIIEGHKGGDYDLIDQEMSRLDVKNQGIARSYMRAFSHWRHQDHTNIPIKVDEDPREQIRFMVRKHNLPLSEEFLRLIERVFTY